MSLDITLSTLSSEYYFLSSEYINTARNFSNLFDSSSGELLISDSIKFFSELNGSNVFLTDSIGLSSIINSLETVGSYQYGFNDKDQIIRYDYNECDGSINSSKEIDTQYVLFINDYVNIFPLQTFKNYFENINEYQKIYFKDKLYIQSKKSTYEIDLENDKLTTFFVPYGISSTSVNDWKFTSYGQGGSCPSNSDVMFISTSEYDVHGDLGFDRLNNFNNGSLLCLWLSSQNYELSSPKKWVEFWYDPKTSSGNLFNFANSSIELEFNSDTDKILTPLEKISYLRYGPERNDSFIDNIPNNILNIKNWEDSFSTETLSGTVYNFKTNLEGNLVLDGTGYVSIIPENYDLFKNNFTISMWLKTENGDDSQLFGNFNAKGFGIFYNTGKMPNSICVPSTSGIITSLNHRGFKIFEKNIVKDLSLSSCNIELVNKDLLSYTWGYDSSNKTIYKIENDDLIVSKITLPDDSSIVKMENNSYNDLFILDNFSNTISSFDTDCSFISSMSLPADASNFTIDLDNEIVTEYANILTVDNTNKKVYNRGQTLYYDDNAILYFDRIPADIKIGPNNNIYVLFQDELKIVDSNGKILNEINISTVLPETRTNMCFVSNKSEILLWIALNDNKNIIVTDLSGRIVKNIKLKNFQRNCEDVTFNLVGNFSNFDNYRKFNILNDESISTTNKSLSIKTMLKCSSGIKKMIQENISVDDFKKWTHVAFSIGYKEGQTIISVFINGVKKLDKKIQGYYSIDNDESSPILIGDYSGKLLPRRLEKAINNEFLRAEIGRFLLFSSSLDDYSIKCLSIQDYFLDWKDGKIVLPIPETTFIEEFDKFYINRYKGYKSNKFNIVIKNFTGNEDLQNIIKSYIRSNISKFVPANNVLNDILFE